MEEAAEDEADRQRVRAQLYASPTGYRAQQRNARPHSAGMNREQAQGLVARLAAEDAQFGSG